MHAQREFKKFEDDSVKSADLFGIFREDENKIEKTFEWKFIDFVESLDFHGISFNADTEW